VEFAREGWPICIGSAVKWLWSARNLIAPARAHVSRGPSVWRRAPHARLLQLLACADLSCRWLCVWPDCDVRAFSSRSLRKSKPVQMFPTCAMPKTCLVRSL